MRNRLAVLGLVVLLGGCSTPRETAKTPGKAEAPKGPVRAPDKFQARFETTKGNFTIEVNRDWAPRAADRFYELIDRKYFEGARFYRVVKKFIVQFGVSKDPKSNQLWSQLKMVDDPPKQPNRRRYVSFAQQGSNTRTTQVFINLADNSKKLQKSDFVPFGEVISGMDVVDQIYAGYGDMPPRGEGPDAGKYATLGDEYISRSFSRLDTIQSVKLVP